MDEMNAVFGSMLKRLESQLTSKLVTLVQQRTLVETEKAAADAIIDAEQGLRNVSSLQELIIASKDLQHTAIETCEKPVTDIAPNFVTHTDFINELVPSYEGAEFILHNYTSLREKARGDASEALYRFDTSLPLGFLFHLTPIVRVPSSEPFISSSGLTWRLKVCESCIGSKIDTRSLVLSSLCHGCRSKRQRCRA